MVAKDMPAGFVTRGIRLEPPSRHAALVAEFRGKLADKKSPLDKVAPEQLAQARKEFRELPEVAGEPLLYSHSQKKTLGVRRMLAEEVIKALEEALALAPKSPTETPYQSALQVKLTAMGLKWDRRHLPNLGGYSQPDIFVPDTDPPLLIEIKASGDWQNVAKAAAQLYGYAEMLSETSKVTVLKLAVFGTKLQHDLLKGMLEKLDTKFIWKA
jgi:hypothetical protein